ncbi:hypothetical protein [Acinetobacter baumannii]|uniref:hypothetical protein n=1 Tax=Acinetobacter baumannii TaxID=470 RepID=UPI001E4E956C|nr:hypothetical protein [Acinetobacter baumannii]
MIWLIWEFTDLTLVIRLEDGSLAERVIASHTKDSNRFWTHQRSNSGEWAEP